MSPHTQNQTSRSPAQAPKLPLPTTVSTHVPSTTPQSLKRTHAAASPENATTSQQPPPKRISIKDQRRELTRSIIATLPRDALEKLLLDAALGNAGIMQEVIKANSLKRADVSSPESTLEKERTLEQPSQSPRLRQDVTVSGSGDGLVYRGADEDLVIPAANVPRSTEDLDVIPTFEDTGPLQFHHTTYRRFEARKAQILDMLRRNSPQETTPPDRNGTLNASPAGGDRSKDSATSMRWG